ANDAALRDSLSSFETKLKAFEGDGPPSDVDIVYFTVSSGKREKETLNGLQTKLLYLMQLLQAADAEPTTAQVASTKDENELLGAMAERWKTWGGSAVAEMNRMLEQHHQPELKLEGAGR